MHKIIRDLNIQMGHSIHIKRPDLMLIYKKKRTCYQEDFAVPVHHTVKMKENEKINKYLDPGRELKNLWNMKVMIIPIIVEILGTVPKGFEKGMAELEIRETIEAIHY